MGLADSFRRFREGYSEGVDEHRRKKAEKVAAKVKEHELSGHRFRRSVKNPARIISYPFRRRKQQQQPIQVNVNQAPIALKEKKGPGLGAFLVILIIISILGTFYCQFYPGTCSVFVSQIKASEIGNKIIITKDAIIQGLPFYAKFPEELAKIGKFENPVVAQKPKEKRGVIISQFKSFKPFYEDGDKIILDGLVDIINVEDDLRLDLSCSAEDQIKSIEIEVVGIESTKGVNQVSTTVKGSPFGGTKTVSVRCTLPKDSYSSNFKDKSRVGKSVKLNVKYDVKTTTILDLYVGNEERLSSIGGENLLKRNDLLDNLKSTGLWKGDGQIRSLQIGAKVPIPASIQLLARQPLTKQNADLVIGIINTASNKIEWGGNLYKLKFLEIFSLNKQQVTINQNSCENFIDGKLSSQIIKNINEKINNVCYSKNKNSEDCVKFRDNSLAFRCGIKIQEAPEGDLIDVYKLRTNAIYTYGVSKDSSVQIRKKEDSLFTKLDKNTNGITTNAILFTENLLKKL